MSKDPNKKPKKRGCLKIFLITLAVIFALIVVVFVIAINSDTDTTNTDVSDANDNVIFDVTQFANVTPEQLVSIMGEPEDIDEWNYKSEKGDIPLTSYCYDNDNYEFIFHEGKISKLELYCNNGKELYPFNANDKTPVLNALGIVPGNDCEKYVNNDMVLRYSDVTEDIEDVSIYDIDKTNGTCDTIHITYDDYND